MQKCLAGLVSDRALLEWSRLLQRIAVSLCCPRAHGATKLKNGLSNIPECM
jgi:hypothetical protein